MSFLNGWCDLEVLISEGFPYSRLIDRKCRVVDESDGWGELEFGDEGVLAEVGDRYSIMLYEGDYEWGGRNWCFEVWMSDEEDIL
jgi:hypothetical protein